jgi:hypothetical protein
MLQAEGRNNKCKKLGVNILSGMTEKRAFRVSVILHWNILVYMQFMISFRCLFVSLSRIYQYAARYEDWRSGKELRLKISIWKSSALGI